MSCRLCVHPDRQAIEASIIKGQSLRSISLSRGRDLSENTLRHHKAKCMKEVVNAAVAYRTVTSGDSVLATLDHVLKEAERIGKEAEKKRDHRSALLALREMQRVIELGAKLTGQIQQEQASPLADPRWHRIRDAIVEALVPFPEAQRAVAQALGRLRASHRGGSATLGEGSKAGT